MYKLYGDIGGLKLLDVSKEEKFIIETLTDYVKSKNDIYYMIIKNENNQDIPYKFISSLYDYKEYMEDYKYRQVKELKLTKE